MSYDENRISDLIDKGLLEEKRQLASNFVKSFIEGHELEKNDNGVYVYTCKSSHVNLLNFCEQLIIEWDEKVD